MAWSIFQQGGGAGAAVTWAHDLLAALGVEQSPQNVQFVYNWEQAEGGGGKFNPLNQGPVPGHPELTTTGPQYGGGAADYASWQAGIRGAVDYINMPAYAGVLKGLKTSNYQQSASALWNSPWAASHYGYGANWPKGTPPGAAPLPGDTTGNFPQQAQTTSVGTDLLGTLGEFLGLKGFNIVDALERLGLILLGGFLILLGVYLLAGKQVLQMTPAGRFTPQGRQREERRGRERAAETRREAREQRQARSGEMEERRLSIRERRQALAERVEERHRGGGAS